MNTNMSILDKYQLLEELGRGTFGVVHRAKEIATGKFWAAKIVRLVDETDKTPIRREVNIMRKLQHPRILQLHEVFDCKGETVFHSFLMPSFDGIVMAFKTIFIVQSYYTGNDYPVCFWWRSF